MPTSVLPYPKQLHHHAKNTSTLSTKSLPPPPHAHSTAPISTAQPRLLFLQYTSMAINHHYVLSNTDVSSVPPCSENRHYFQNTTPAIVPTAPSQFSQHCYKSHYTLTAVSTEPPPLPQHLNHLRSTTIK